MTTPSPICIFTHEHSVSSLTLPPTCMWYSKLPNSWNTSPRVILGFDSHPALRFFDSHPALRFCAKYEHRTVSRAFRSSDTRPFLITFLFDSMTSSYLRLSFEFFDIIIRDLWDYHWRTLLPRSFSTAKQVKWLKLTNPPKSWDVVPTVQKRFALDQAKNLIHVCAWIRSTRCTKNCAGRAQILVSENKNNSHKGRTTRLRLAYPLRCGGYWIECQ